MDGAVRAVVTVTICVAIAVSLVRKKKQPNIPQLFKTGTGCIRPGYVSGLAEKPLPNGAPERLKFDEQESNEEGRQMIGSIVDSISLKVVSSDQPIVIGIAGGTGSGKTTLARAVYESLGSENVTYICHDQYYKDLKHLPEESRTKVNFDHPNSLDTDLLVKHIKDLKSKKNSESIVAYPHRVIIIEGLLLFSDENLRKSIDIKIFVDTDADVRFIRRLRRDISERGRTVESVISQYLSTVRPMHEQFIEPSRRYCDMIVPVGLNAVALDLVVSRLRLAIGA